jgi:hypothetical protein
MAGRPQSGLFSGLSIHALLRAMGRVRTVDLTATESSSTLFRFFRSKHVRDLKLIFAAALFVLISHAIVVLILGLAGAVEAFLSPPQTSELAPWFNVMLWPPKVPTPDLWDRTVAAASAFFSFTIKYIGPAIPIYGIIVGWAYQSASSRLGIVDLFGCEIATICRVGTIFDVGKFYIDMYKGPSAEKREPQPAPDKMAAAEKKAAAEKFVSEEEYFPVFENNSRDLQLLEASVVNNITQFYTYMKAARDSLRRLGIIDPPTSEQPSPTRIEDRPEPDHPWRTALANVIYLVYLGYESARKAIKDLIEFQPDKAERLSVILVTELRCYAFLRRYFCHDSFRSSRLQLRVPVYKQEVAELYLEVKENQNREDWLQARETLPELEARYQEALDESLRDAALRLQKQQTTPDADMDRSRLQPMPA